MRRQIITAIRQPYAGTMRHGDPIILDGLIEDIKRLSNTPAEMDWLSSQQSTKARITQGFGTNPIVMGEVENANRASATVADQHFVDNTANPKIELISQCLTEWLGPMFASDGERLLIWIERCTVHDAEMAVKRMDVLGKYAAVTGNELRAWAGLPEDPMFDSPIGMADERSQAIGHTVDHAIGRIGIDLLTSGNGNGRHESGGPP
jgi:phage portal protein BeeE